MCVIIFRKCKTCLAYRPIALLRYRKLISTKVCKQILIEGVDLAPWQRRDNEWYDSHVYELETDEHGSLGG